MFWLTTCCPFMIMSYTLCSSTRSNKLPKGFFLNRLSLSLSNEIKILVFVDLFSNPPYYLLYVASNTRVAYPRDK